MTHDESSLRTKKALCDSLKELMKHKAFSKITVSELTRECDVNRKTFYYHFEDIYALLKWMLQQEAIEVVKQFNLLVDYQDAFEFVFKYVNQNSFFLNCIYDSVGRDELKRFFYQDIIGIIEQIIRNSEKELGVTITDNFRTFLTNLYTEGIAGMLINLFQNPDCYNHDEIINYFSTMIRKSIPAVILSQKIETSETGVF
jgi:probable dihydroxyacetone kinase regulator